MPLKQNVIANYLGRAYSASIGMIMIPVYLNYLGKEAYGLVGFYAVLSSCLALLDFGLITAFGREVARYQDGVVNNVKFRTLLWNILSLFSGGGLLVIILIAFLSGFITNHWLNVETIPHGEVKTTIELMGLVFAFRWPTEIFRNILVGLEQQVWLNSINVAVATFRFIGIVPIFIWVGASPKIFFIFQAIVAVVELIFLINVSYRLIPAWFKNIKKFWSLKPIYKIRKFALNSALTSLIWVIITQTDKLILTRILPLSKYAYFSIATTAAMGILSLLGPITQAVLPRLTRLLVNKNNSAFQSLYRKTTRMVCVLAGSVAVILATYPKEILWTWTGDRSLSISVSPVLAFYALGYAFLTISDMQYFLQMAHGDLQFQIKGHLLFLLVLVPSISWGTLHYGMTGAALCWMILSLLFLLIWVPVVHHHFLPDLHSTWLFSDIFPIVCSLGIMMLLMSHFPIHQVSRIKIFLYLSIWSFITLTAAGLATPDGRSVIIKIIKKFI